jgi:hypothetical protein
MQQCKEMAVFLLQRMEGVKMNRKYKNSFNKDNIDRMFSEPNDTGSIRMLSIHPQMGIKMILECDSELEEIFCDDSEIIFSLDTKNIYLSCPASELLHIGKRVYLMGTGVAYRLNRDDEYADMSSEEMAETCLELFGRMQRVWMDGFGFPVLDLTDMEADDEEEK